MAEWPIFEYHQIEVWLKSFMALPTHPSKFEVKASIKRMLSITILEIALILHLPTFHQAVVSPRNRHNERSLLFSSLLLGRTSRTKELPADQMGLDYHLFLTPESQYPQFAT